MRCRSILTVSISIALLASGIVVEPSRALQSDPPRQVASPPGQIVVVTVNADQVPPKGVFAFNRLLELARAMRHRPAAFNGGFHGAVIAPDVVTVQELRQGNAEDLRRLIQQRYEFDYVLAGPPNSRSKFFYNADTVELVGGINEWSDACINGLPPNEDEPERTYQWARFIDKGTGAPFVVAGVHFRNRYPEEDCKPRNVELLRLQVETAPEPAILMGDFNLRPVQVPHLCDPDERSDPMAWWMRMTSPGAVERVYVDAVSSHHRRTRQSLAREWTFEGKRQTEVCDGTTTHRRGRIDYIFVSDAVVAEAHADHPGWGGPRPGDRHPENRYYSDHRFVWARLVVSGPRRPARPTVEPEAGGAIHVEWDPLDEARRYVVYRARPGRAFARAGVARNGETSFRDINTQHGVRYRYRIAAIGLDGGHGWESLPAAAAADARGPRVVRVTPARGTTRVPRGTSIEVRYDERVARSSVTPDRIGLFRGSRQVRGRIRQAGPRLLVFEPARRLARNTRYRVVARPVADVVGNRGSRFSWRFTTRRR